MLLFVFLVYVVDCFVSLLVNDKERLGFLFGDLVDVLFKGRVLVLVFVILVWEW